MTPPLSGAAAGAFAPTFPPLDVAPRLDRLRVALGGIGCDALVVTNPTNVRYLTGFTGSAGVLLVSTDSATLITDGRYEQQAAEQIAAARAAVQLVITSTEQRERCLEAAAGCSSLGLEAASVSWAQQRRYAEWFPDLDLVPTEGLVEDLRAIKDPGELARMEAAAAIADAALAADPTAAARRGHRGRVRPGTRLRYAPPRCAGQRL